MANSVTRTAVFALVCSGAMLTVAAAPRVAHYWRESEQVHAALGPLGKARVASGTEVLLYFIGSSTCGASQEPNLPNALRTIRNAMVDSLKKINKRVIYVGVAVDETPEEGIRFLRNYGPFDEVIAGGSWLGTGSLDLLIRSLPGPLALPQLMVVERDIQAKQTTITVSADRLQIRKIGSAEILSMAGLTSEGIR